MHKSLYELISGKSAIGFLGLGRSNLSLLRMLPYDISIRIRSDGVIDRSAIPEGFKQILFFEGKNCLLDIDEDVLFLSPSVRRDRRELISATARGVALSSDPELFFSEVSAPVFAVSGSSGKSTTAHLASTLISSCGARSVICGNVGKPMLDAISPDAELYVAELSSFMLQYGSISATRAVITNITPNHLDWHSSFEEYVSAKLSLLDRAEEKIISADDRILSDSASGRRLFGAFSVWRTFTELRKLLIAENYVTLEDGHILLNGERMIDSKSLTRGEIYNISNMSAALLLALGHYSKKDAVRVLSSFSGLSHRCEVVCTIGGVRYINSSIDTTPERCAATVAALAAPIILLLGGRSKGLPIEPLYSPIKKWAKAILTFGEDGERLHSLLSPITKCEFCGTLRLAVERAAELAAEGDAVLLSPAGTSYDAYSSFEERGADFARLARQVTLK